MIIRPSQQNGKLILGNNQKKGVQQVSDFWNAQLSGNEHQFIKNICPGVAENWWNNTVSKLFLSFMKSKASAFRQVNMIPTQNSVCLQMND